MSASTTARGRGAPDDGCHPDDRDLLNLARERLGKKKTQRIFDHCKECPACADRLLEAVRNHGETKDRAPLSRGNWISIGLFVASIIAVIAAMLWFLRSAAQPPIG